MTSRPDWVRIDGDAYVLREAVLRALGGGERLWDDLLDSAIAALHAKSEGHPAPAVTKGKRWDKTDPIGCRGEES
jgi:hypothetical protein